jgi:CRP/FNR family cyclic AMP-dependent transcriptional regulator
MSNIKQWDRLVPEWAHAADTMETSRRELLAQGERISLSHKGRWTVDRVKGATVLTAPQNHTIFSQGEAANAVFFIQAGTVKLTVVSPQGQEAVVAMLERDAFVGESCLAGQPVHSATATAVEDSTLVRLGKDAMIRGLHEEPAFAEQFLSYLLAHTIRFQEALVDHIINSSEKRLARVLLSLAHSKDKGKPEAVLPKLSHETFAAMVGTTRSRVSFFMNRFRNLGYIDYHGHSGEVRVRRSLFNVLLNDGRPSYR